MSRGQPLPHWPVPPGDVFAIRRFAGGGKNICSTKTLIAVEFQQKDPWNFTYKTDAGEWESLPFDKKQLVRARDGRNNQLIVIFCCLAAFASCPALACLCFETRVQRKIRCKGS